MIRYPATAGLLFVTAVSGWLVAPGLLPDPIPGETPRRSEGAIATSRAILESLMDEADLPGLSVAVAVAGEVVWSEGFGLADIESGVAVTPLTRFRVGSLSKAFTSAAMMTLVEEGRLDLDAPIRTYLPEFPDKGYPITSRQLAGHLGGIRHYDEGEGISHVRYDDVVDALEIFASDTLLHAPGSAYEYSSYGYNLLSAVIQRAADEPFLDFVRRSVFEPLAMRHTVADHIDSIIPNRTGFYRRDGVLVNAEFTDNSYKWAGGGFLSTAEDLARFGSGLLRGDLLSQRSLESLFTSQVDSAGEATGYGMGWRPREDWRGERVIHHGGGSRGGRAFLLMYPERELVVVLLSNMEDAPLFEQEAQTLAHFFLEHPAAEPVAEPPADFRGGYDFVTRPREEELRGTLFITGSGGRPGWMSWDETTLALTVVDTLHADHARIVGAGRQGLLNLWVEFSQDGFEGRWDWLGRTVPIRATRR